jgi:predicted amidohydrolase YtcJ
MREIRPGRLALLAAMLGTAAACGGDLPADRVFLNGAVYTVDMRRSRTEAVAVRDGRIIHVGSNDDVRRLAGSGTEVTDLGGAMLLPGFHDSHIHILIGIATQDDCDLLRLESQAEVDARLRECQALPGYGPDRWVLGGGWSEWLWPDANPGKAQLDALFPDRPVYIESSFGHAAWVNSRALALAGVTKATGNPPEGVIERDAAGEPSGTLRDAAMLLVKRGLPAATPEQNLESVRAGIDLAHSVGITAVIEPGLDAELIAPVVALADANELSLRVRASLSPLNWQPGAFDDGVFAFLEGRDRWRRPGLDVDSVKIYMDGVIEYGTGALLEPYAKAVHGLGPRFYAQEQVDRYFTRFDAMGLAIHVHATGDAAIRRALDGFAAMRKANGMSDNRHHIVHLQLIDEADRPRFAALGITATFQPLWAYPDPAALELDIPMLGEQRTQAMYPIGSLVRSGARVAGGSDYFVTDLNPLHAIEAAVTRQDPYTNSGPVLNADERVDLDTMVAAYTINGAWLMGLEKEQGSIEVGKRADFVVLDRDLFAGPASAINEAKVLLTVFGGRTVYEARAD